MKYTPAQMRNMAHDLKREMIGHRAGPMFDSAADQIEALERAAAADAERLAAQVSREEFLRLLAEYLEGKPVAALLEKPGFDAWPAHLKEDAYKKLGVRPQTIYIRAWLSPETTREGDG